ncbi:hypothetical protein [Mycobacterium sp.]|uniref:hypothetical protein n=1 Tax=Mycobacterium sp. TaxID=1785 RepID=UPI0025E662BD|nr:hypothetical protein [Mycobacterium sp.]
MARDFFIAQTSAPFSSDRWSRSTIYDFVISHRPDAPYTAAIPRLYLTPNHRRTAARLLFSQALEVGAGGHEVVAYIWDPADDRGHVAIAFPVRDSRGAPPADTALRLLALLPTVTAVVIPDDDYNATPEGQRRNQPAIWVADGIPPDAQPHTWDDIANLLRTKLPWWSYGLRDRDAMLAWRPGTPSTAVAPGTAHRDLTALPAVLTPDSSPTLRVAVDTITAELQHDVCGAYRHHRGHDHFSDNHGLQHAATADLDFAQPRPTRTTGQAALFLHHQVANPLAAAHAAQVAGGAPIAHAAYIITATHQRQPIVQNWLNRLQLSRRRDELGFQLALQAIPPEVQLADPTTPTRYYSDPRNPDCWIVTHNHTVIVTCGTSVPASGVLEKAYLDAGAAFFLDSDNIAWPMPYPALPDEDSESTLAQTLTRLIGDAGADVDDPGSAVPTNEELVRRIRNATLPIVIS